MDKEILNHMDLPFEWGEHDCATFAADVVKAMTGHDPIADIRGKWHSKEEAAQYDLRGELDARLTPVKREFAGRGDILLCHTPQGPCIGVCIGNYAATTGESGLVYLPRTAWRRAWRV